MPVTPVPAAPTLDAGATAVRALPAEADAGAVIDATAAPPEPQPAAEPPPCPDGMILVDVSYCPKMERVCVDKEYSPQNHITICHKFAKAQRCLVPEERRRFCVDEYEYPNRKGAHPPWMVSWYDAQATCALHDKRLCYESEWVAACEGPENTPFPYGLARDNSKCNIDNAWIDPNLAYLYERCIGRITRMHERFRRSRHDGQFRRVDYRRTPPQRQVRQVRMGGAQGRSLGPRSKCVPPDHHQPPARFHLLLHRIPVLQGRDRL
jgi:hypothetical protein